MVTTTYKDINTMAKDPAFLFYPGDYVTGTMYLNFECKGAYIDLLMLQFQKDHMSLHMIQHVLGHKFNDIWPHIRDKFVEKDGMFWNERLRKEKENRVNYSKSRSSNRNSKKDMSNHMLQHMEDEDIIESNTIVKLEETSRVLLPFNGKFSEKWEEWKIYKKKEHKFKYQTEISENAALKKLVKLSGNNEADAIQIIDESIANGWEGFFELKKNNNGKRVQNNSGSNRTNLPTKLDSGF